MIMTSANKGLLVFIFSILFVSTSFLAWHNHRTSVFYSIYQYTTNVRPLLLEQLESDRGTRDESADQFRAALEGDGYSAFQIPLDIIRDELDKVQGPDEEIIKEFIEMDDSFSFKPPLKFLENLTNPCWMEKEFARRGRIRCLPYFYLAGFPKCGTTDLWFRLQVSEDVVPLPLKEPHWWTRYRYDTGDRGRPAQDMKEYTELFKLDHTVPWQIAGDGSQSTIWDDLFIQTKTDTTKLSSAANRALSKHEILPIHLIHHFTPHAKYIFLLRNPVDRLYSDYLYFSRASDRVSQEDFHEKAMDGISGMLGCIRREGIRQCTYSSEIRRKYSRQMRIMVSLYVVFINDLLKTVSRENVLILTLNDYSSHRTAVLKRVTNFLKLKVDDALIAKMDSLERANTRPKDMRIGPMLPRTRAMIQKFYHPFNQALAEIMEDENLAAHAPEARDETLGDEDEEEDDEADEAEED